MIVVKATTTGDKGVIRVSKGIASRLADHISAVTDEDTGSLTLAADGVTSEIDAIDEDIEDLNDGVERYIEDLQVQFARMETAMSQSLSLLEWMTLQIQYLPGSSGASSSGWG